MIRPPGGGLADEQSPAGDSRGHTIVRILRFAGGRLLMLAGSVVIGVYLAVLIANMGGHVDEIRRGQIREGVAIMVSLDQEFRQQPQEQRQAMIEEMVRIEEQRLGLERPFIIRSVLYLGTALSLNLGRAEQITSDSGSRQVRLVILERLPSTLLLFATAQLFLFFSAVLGALFLSRRYGSRLDRTVVALAPLSAAPPWFYGLFLILIFAAVLGVMPFGGMVAAPPPRTTIPYIMSLLRHLVLPVSAIVISGIFLATYSWRTFFMIYSSEDYVDMAKAKGLTSGMIERRYVLRPTMPTIVTSFALLVIGLWTGAIITETVFNWPGLGQLIYRAIGFYDTTVIVGSVVIYAYLLALTVFLLDFAYALLDPRVKVGARSAH